MTKSIIYSYFITKALWRKIMYPTKKIKELIIKNTENLSPEALHEILDFIQFIKIKKISPDNINAELSNLNNSELKHLEKEFQDFSDN